MGSKSAKSKQLHPGRALPPSLDLLLPSFSRRKIKVNRSLEDCEEEMDSNTYFRLHQIEAITDDFSEDKKIGCGGHANYYKAVLNGEEIAVKRLHALVGLDDKPFDNEIRNLNKVRHKNIIRLIGYCHESQLRYIEHNGELVAATIRERLLFLEYMHGGSLDQYIEDESCQLDWPICYQIIQGTCEGLNHLHKGHKNPVFHLDLKPANILLDGSMTPKIKGFHFSRCAASLEDDYPIEIIQGTLGYVPPEYIDNGTVSNKFDVFSLGTTIMRMMAGNNVHSLYHEISPKEFTEIVSEKWKVRLQAMSEYSSHENDILRVRKCVEIALKCVQTDREKRPSIEDILHELQELEADIKLPRSLQSASKPSLPLQHLKDITNDFCNERILGRGGFGVVYKGVLQNGKTIAIKKLLQSTPKSQKQFENELNLLMELEHPNIVPLVGYCYDTQHSYMPHEGRFVSAWSTEIFLCLECLPNGSLYEYISDASSGLNWNTRFKIIEGISYGIKYLHEQFTGPIIHLDLKPANILLDENFLPKITDFGLSRLFDQNQTIRTATSTGTLGYMSLEYQLRGIITPMADVFSLGVIIMEVITGHRDYPYDIRTSSESFISLELLKWRNMLQKEPGCTSLEADCQQIQKCIQIGLICVNPERTKRPTMKKIVDMLQGLENLSSYITNELSPATHMSL